MMLSEAIRWFVGEWQFIPGQSKYEMGILPKQARYRIEPAGDGLSFTAEWVTPADKAYQVTYQSIPDGKPYPYDNPSLADTISTNLIDPHTLDTAVIKDHIIVSYARRTLSNDGRLMTVTQSGFTADGRSFDNLSVYKKAERQQSSASL
ncbi:hypothetical protein [Paenibacillus abyssi]|uniref:Uncharacterized protein n=1 Tax=Paenibacillus abyssi TaxID=1340531 RepID=A0A917FZ83_9BACL|nr:hypothetical protein [Paenibacillus abyssi]GGG14968.1 hypothetical protein GCM10010916_34870 [Paenibacillus abyssi]